VAAEQIVTIQQGKGITHKKPYAHARS
jgi:hypothetical protein